MAVSRPRLDHHPTPPPWRAVPYREIQKRIGAELRTKYQPPKELPPRLLTLLREIDKLEDDDG
jgi:hypothetical protein